jgi:SAM-dependent methyltransferase
MATVMSDPSPALLPPSNVADFGVHPVAASNYSASDGAGYEFLLGRWSTRLADEFLDFAEFPDVGDLLDVGCGTGSLARAMAKRWPARRIVGIDAAEPYVAFARSRRAANQPVFDIGDACALPYGDTTFAGAAAQLVLNFIPTPDIALGEMRRVTRSGGTVAATVWDFRGGVVYQRLFWDTAAGIDPQASSARARLFSATLTLPGALLKLFEDMGLGQIKRGSITIRMDYANFDDYWHPLLGGQGPIGAYLTALAPTLRDRIEAAMRNAYFCGAPDGPRSMTATAWAVRGIVP